MTTATAEPDLYPQNFTEAKRALRAKASRTVFLSDRVTPRDRCRIGLAYEVTGPTREGEQITVHVNSGMIPLRVLSGNVTVLLGSNWGNVVTVTDDARESTYVHVHPGCKVTAYGVDPEHLSGDLRRVRTYPPADDHRLAPAQGQVSA